MKAGKDEKSSSSDHMLVRVLMPVLHISAMMFSLTVQPDRQTDRQDEWARRSLLSSAPNNCDIQGNMGIMGAT